MRSTLRTARRALPPGPRRAVRPLLLSRLSAGFASPAEDTIDRPLDLHAYVVANPAATYFLRVEGDSMSGDGILDGDLVVIDRSVEAAEGHVVVACLDGEFTLKRLRLRTGRVMLEPSNPRYRTVEVLPEQDFRVWGVVRFAVRDFR